MTCQAVLGDAEVIKMSPTHLSSGGSQWACSRAAEHQPARQASCNADDSSLQCVSKDQAFWLNGLCLCVSQKGPLPCYQPCLTLCMEAQCGRQRSNPHPCLSRQLSLKSQRATGRVATCAVSEKTEWSLAWANHLNITVIQVYA